MYCHAVAAGLCATCGALCCADCVELELGWTTRRAVCHACLRARGTAETRPSRGLGWIVVVAALVGLGAWIFIAN